MSERHPDLAFQERLEAERTEYKIVARRVLSDLFKDCLERAELEKRLALLDRVKFVTQIEMDRIAQNNSKDAGADGLIQYEVDEIEVRRIPVVLHSGSRVDTLHTLVHEGVHLMSPEPALVADPNTELGEETFADYIGGLRFERLRKTNAVDQMSVYSDFTAHFLFWEMVTDWLAEFGLVEEISEAEHTELETSGYFERHWIGYLLRLSPDAGDLISALKESYAAGNEDPLRWCLQRQLGVKDDVFYDELFSIVGRARTDESRVDDWMAVVDRSFNKK